MNKNSSLNCFYFVFLLYNELMKEVIAVSACLVGANTRWDGKNNFNQQTMDYLKDKMVILICPEIFAGMTIPREPSEILAGKAITKEGKDVTNYFVRGAEATLKLLKEYNCKKVILKDGSPSCGYSQIHNGSFDGGKINGLGFTTKLLKENGIEVIILS